MTWRIQKLEERKKALVAQSEAILEAAAKEDREPTEEETKTLETNRTELEGVAAKIKRETELAAFVQSAPAERAQGDGGWPGQSGAGSSGTRTANGRTRAAFEEDPNKGFKSPREFLMAVMQNTDRPSREASDERLRFLATAGSDEQGSYSDPYGGFLVPTGFSPQLLQLSPEDDPIGGRTTQIPMTAPKIEINARVDKNHATSVTGGLTVTRRTETQEGTAKRMEMEKVKLSAYSLFGLAYATEEILQDSPISFAALLEAGFRDQFSSHMIDERINGTGVGEFEGILKSPSLVTVSKEGSQTADTISYLNVVKMRSRCWRYSQAVWLYNHDSLPQLMQLVLPTGTASGVSMWQNSAREGEPDLLFGRPAIATEYCNTLGDLGDILLCNWSQYLEGTYQALQSAESIHVRFLSHERTFKFWLRNAGKCWWRSPLTPKKSASTLSPFVALEAR